MNPFVEHIHRESPKDREEINERNVATNIPTFLNKNNQTRDRRRVIYLHRSMSSEHLHRKKDPNH